MTEANDHDILITIQAKLDLLLQTVNKANDKQDALAERVHGLESKDRGDSERMKAVYLDIQKSNNNSTRIADAFQQMEGMKTEIANLKEEVSELKKKSNMWDIANGIGVAIAGAVGWFR
jgi:thymidylate kinase